MLVEMEAFAAGRHHYLFPPSCIPSPPPLLCVCKVRMPLGSTFNLFQCANATMTGWVGGHIFWIHPTSQNNVGEISHSPESLLRRYKHPSASRFSTSFLSPSLVTLRCCVCLSFRSFFPSGNKSCTINPLFCIARGASIYDLRCKPPSFILLSPTAVD